MNQEIEAIDAISVRCVPVSMQKMKSLDDLRFKSVQNALYMARRALELCGNKGLAWRVRTNNEGQEWSDDEIADLRSMIYEGCPVRSIADFHKRPMHEVSETSEGLDSVQVDDV